MGERDPSGVSVRLCEHRDIAAITRLNNDAIKAGWSHFGTEPVAAVQIGQRWDRDRAAYPWLTAEVDGGGGGEFAGFAKASAWKSRGAYRWTVEIGVYVEESARQRGIGRRLYEDLFKILSAQGFVVAFAGVSLPNAASERLHEAVGMTPACELAPAGYKLGKWRSVRYYTKHLNAMVDGVEPAEPRAVDEVAGAILVETRS